jgi:hypothetical protein
MVALARNADAERKVLAQRNLNLGVGLAGNFSAHTIAGRSAAKGRLIELTEALLFNRDVENLQLINGGKRRPHRLTSTTLRSLGTTNGTLVSVGPALGRAGKSSAYVGTSDSGDSSTVAIIEIGKQRRIDQRFTRSVGRYASWPT